MQAIFRAFLLRTSHSAFPRLIVVFERKGKSILYVPALPVGYDRREIRIEESEKNDSCGIEKEQGMIWERSCSNFCLRKMMCRFRVAVKYGKNGECFYAYNLGLEGDCMSIGSAFTDRRKIIFRELETFISKVFFTEICTNTLF